MPKLSCIICAYNEAPRIGAVLAVASVHPLIDEVIVVDDGSVDATADIVRTFPNVRLILHPSNCGKSAAVATGVALASHDYLMLLDADLEGLTRADLRALAEPVLSGRADVSISLRRNSLFIYRALGIDFVSGERVFRRELLSEAIGALGALPRFGIEVFANSLIIARRMSIAVVRWDRVSHVRKTDKVGRLNGLIAEWRMLLNIVETSNPVTVLVQAWMMRQLRIGEAARWRSRAQ